MAHAEKRSVMELADQVALLCRQREATLIAMTPEKRNEYIEKWANRLAEDVCSLKD